MSTLPSPLADPTPWDAPRIAGVSWTGGLEIGGDLLKRKLDTRPSAGRDGARIRDRGYDLAEIDLTFTLYKTEHFGQLSQIVSALFPRSTDTTRRRAWPVVHPALGFAGITEIYGKALGALKGPDEQMRWTIQVSCVQYRPEAQRTTAHRPTAATAAPDLGANATAFDRQVERAPPAAPSTQAATTAPTRT